MTDAPSIRHRVRAGFTFMEILFAVMILGVGFIMVAAMFPAALRQTQANVEAAAFNTIANTALVDMQNLAYTYDPKWSAAYAVNNAVGVPARFLDQLTGWIVTDPQEPLDFDPAATIVQPRTGRPVPFSFHDPRFTGGNRFTTFMTVTNPGGTYTPQNIIDGLWDLVRGNMIVADKREYAWVPLWSRGQRMVNAQPVADASLNLFIFPVRSRAKSQYDPNLSLPTISGPAVANPACDVSFNFANLDPQLITIKYHPPSGTSTINAPYGVLEVNKLCSTAGDLNQTAANSQPAAIPVVEGAYVVISDSNQAILPTGTNPYPKMYNGMIFKIGSEAADASGSAGTSGSIFWTVAEIDNLPTEQPFNLTDAKTIGANDFSAEGIFALVIGRQPDPHDAAQQSASTRQASPYVLLNRTGPAQELGFYPTSVPLK